MTIASDLTRIKDAKAAIRQAIIDKGVEVPETEKLDTYYSYIDQITGKPSGPTGDGTLADLKLALSTENPAEYYPVGTEIPDTYDGNDNPLIVAQYLNSSNNSTYGGAVGVILMRKYVEPTSQVFGTNNDYRTSTVKSYLDTTYLDNCSSELKSIISDINIPWYYSSTGYTTVTSRWFLMSDREVNSLLWTQVEGFAWDYWKQKTGLSSPNANANPGRILYASEGAPSTSLLRSNGGSTSIGYVQNTGRIFYTTPTSSAGVLPACFIAKE